MESTSFRTFPLGSSTTKLCSTVPLFTTLKVTSPAATLTSLGAHLNSVAVSAPGGPPDCTPQGHSGGEEADPRGAEFSPEAYSGSVGTLTGASGPSSMRENWKTGTRSS